MRKSLIALLVVGISSGISVGGEAPVLRPSPPEEPTGFLFMARGPGMNSADMPALIKRFDPEQSSWVSVGDQDTRLRLKTGEHRVGIVFSSAPRIVASGKLKKAEPEEGHTVVVDIEKDKITVVPFEITGRAGGFDWTMDVEGPHVVLPARTHERAVDEIIALLDDPKAAEYLNLNHFNILTQELEALADLRSLPALERVEARSSNTLWKKAAQQAIKLITKAHEKKNKEK